jgi:hypothetical protein
MGKAGKRKACFFEKKQQKTFARGAAGGSLRMRATMGTGAKVFWFFFAKKNVFPNA